MTREEAIMVLKNEQPHCGKKALFPEEKKYEAYNMAINALEELPKRRKEVKRWKARTAQIASKQNGWIPVSERLPETNDDVLVTDGVDMFVAWYSRKGMWQGWMSSDNNFERDTPIDAWMPLPKPFDPHESDHKCRTCKHYTSGENDGCCGSYICKGYSDWESEEREISREEIAALLARGE